MNQKLIMINVNIVKGAIQKIAHNNYKNKYQFSKLAKDVLK